MSHDIPRSLESEKWHFVDSKEGKLNRQELDNKLWELIQKGASLPLETIGGTTKFLHREGDEENGEYIITVGQEKKPINRDLARTEIRALALRMFNALPRRQKKGEEQ
ncbi:MAG: hypothetical protein A3B24_02190 [Candidatus Wildermuthbacteria bacterium RIFCSPLOWO2_01_FULL_48_16]|uniref:Uncharacterized protein n=1 Tax=Candidatus Wildermuthbacteria bacterium RIFCSPLOWO2_01_FULL_48_16 TaxID=1802461 RepID=A0A1G2RLN4_9BACT|nr:MAG: hypothetical protein A3J57_02675 [Candidatus Wildermuthbacteria bacterium RIFCSPHIGHO2_02_FULL_49_12b]OHA73398.1 MAG: hypothetical protein A3B24_02190 [Candidatus Wildermuthbacteria bacterium RIFCSPLOWO2_01_FULL_48_16]